MLNSSVPRFNRRSRILRSASPLTDDQIRAVAPSIFADQAHRSRSERYQYIPTSEVLTRLRREGFQPFMVTQGGTRDEEKADFTKHMLRLRHESALGPELVERGDTFREIVLVNSHDGTSSYQLMAGLFRLVCSNGMIVGAGGGFDEVRVKHTGEVIPAVIDGCIQILNRLPEVSAQVRDWSALALTAGEQSAFATATAAAALRYDEGEVPFAPEKLLTLHRREDERPTLWNTLNTVQENVIRGGIGYHPPRRSRPPQTDAPHPRSPGHRPEREAQPRPLGPRRRAPQTESREQLTPQTVPAMPATIEYRFNTARFNGRTFHLVEAPNQAWPARPVVHSREQRRREAADRHPRGHFRQSSERVARPPGGSASRSGGG